MRTAVTAIAAAACMLGATLALAQAPTRIRGTVSAVSGETFTVTPTSGKPLQIHIDDGTRVTFAKPVPMSEIKSGDFLGVTSVKRSDGTLAAYDVRRFPKPVNPGHRPFDGAKDQTMTNAAVS